MTPVHQPQTARTQVDKLILGVLTAVLASLLIPMASDAFEKKVRVDDFRKHESEEQQARIEMMTQLRSISEAQARIEERVQAIYCEGRGRACR